MGVPPFWGCVGWVGARETTEVPAEMEWPPGTEWPPREGLDALLRLEGDFCRSEVADKRLSERLDATGRLVGGREPEATELTFLGA